MDTNKIIEALGGTKQVAELCGVTPSAVSQWRDPRNRIPPAHLRYLKLARPEAFQADDAQPGVA